MTESSVSDALPIDLVDMLRPNSAGLIPAVVQDATTKQVLMMAWMNEEALRLTFTTRRGTYWSRSRNRLWIKGEESGHTQQVRELRLDCDGDTLLLLVDQVGPACHTGTTSCFDTHVLLGEPGSATFQEDS